MKARDLCTRTLRRLGLVDTVLDPSAEEMRDTLAALNEMLAGWASHGVELLLQSEFGLEDEFEFWVPPVDLESDSIALAQFVSTWDASTNTPALSSAVGTQGYVYKVSVAGSTALDDVASWALNDYAVFDGTKWLKGRNSARFNAAVIALLGKRICDDFGKDIPASVALDAVDGWSTIQSYYVKPPKAGFDLALRALPSRTWATGA